MSSIEFHPFIEIKIAVILAVIMLFGLGFLEWKKSIRFKTARLTALAAMIGVLLVYVINLNYKSSTTQKPIMVLTEGYSQAQADSLQKLLSLKVIDLTANSNSFSVKDLPEIQKQIRFVLGNGLPSSSFNGQTNYSFSYLPGKKPQGLIDISIPKFKANISSTIKGTYNSNTSATLKIAGPDYKDSILLQPGLQKFHFDIKPKLPGKFKYLLSTTTESQETVIPVEVPEIKKLNILFLQTFPTFETRYLKNFLEEDGHSVLLRYETSKNIYRYETCNTPPLTSLPEINSEKINQFDLVILSNDAANQLNTKAQQIILESIKRGSGLLIVFNDDKLPTKFLNQTSIIFSTVSYDSALISLSTGSSKFLSLKNRIAPNLELSSIFHDKSGSVTGYLNYGWGRVGFQLLRSTYQLHLAGRKDYYQQLWVSLLDNVARHEQIPYEVNLKPEGPFYINQPVNVEIISNADVPNVYYASEQLPLLEHPFIPNLFQTSCWSNTTGWNKLVLSDSTQYNFYVHSDGESSSLDIANQIRLNKTYHTTTDSEIFQPIIVYKKISPLILFIVFIGCCGFLWLAPKL